MIAHAACTAVVQAAAAKMVERERWMEIYNLASPAQKQIMLEQARIAREFAEKEQQARAEMERLRPKQQSRGLGWFVLGLICGGR